MLWILGELGVVGVGVRVGVGIGGVWVGVEKSLWWIEEGVGDGGGAGSAHRDFVRGLDGGVRVM